MLFPTNSVKYFGVKIDKHFTWKLHIDGISAKLNKANVILSKIRHFDDQKALKAIYHAIFEWNLYYSSLVWALSFSSTKRLFILQKRTLRLMFFLRRDAHANPLFKDCNILKFHDKIALENSIFIHKSFKHQLPQSCDIWFGLSSIFHTHNARWWNLGCLNVHSHRTKLYDRNVVCISAIFTWNYLQNLHRNILFHKLTTKCLKKLPTLHFLRKYVWHDFSHNVSSSTLIASKIAGVLFNWKWLEILFSRFSLALQEGLVEMV